MRIGTQNLATRIGVGSLLAFLALSQPAFARPVGEQLESSSGDSLFSGSDFANLVQIAGSLNGTLAYQAAQTRGVAGTPDTVAAAAAEAGKTLSGEKKTTIGEQESKADSEGPRPSGSLGASLPTPVSPAQMPDLGLSPSESSRSFDRSPGLSTPSIARSGGSGSGSTGSISDLFRPSGSMNRGPAVLPKADPSLRVLQPKTTTFNDKESLNLAKLSQDLLQKQLDNQKKKKDAKLELEKAKQEIKAQKAFEEGISDLLGRTTPYKKKDYEDFRDFIADQKDRLGNVNTAATDFKNKARSAFDMYHTEDREMDTVQRKEEYRKFVTMEVDDTQTLMVPMPHADQPAFFGRPSH